jgi:hypothetical protein
MNEWKVFGFEPLQPRCTKALNQSLGAPQPVTMLQQLSLITTLPDAPYSQSPDILRVHKEGTQRSMSEWSQGRTLTHMWTEVCSSAPHPQTSAVTYNHHRVTEGLCVTGCGTVSLVGACQHLKGPVVLPNSRYHHPTNTAPHHRRPEAPHETFGNATSSTQGPLQPFHNITTMTQAAHKLTAWHCVDVTKQFCMQLGKAEQ